MINRASLFFLTFLILAVCFPVFPQEGNEQDEKIFVINSYEYIIKGITKPYALNYRAEFKTGEEITGQANLEKFIRDKTQIIYNQRVIESVSIEHTVGEAGEDGKYPVDLKIFTKDTWNIMAIPRPKYDSNTGFDISIKARDYNFLGTMSPLRLDLGYQRNNEGQNFYTVMLDSDIPFYLFGLNWNVDFDHDYTYRPDVKNNDGKAVPHYYRNITGISVELPFRRTVFTIGFAEWFIYNQENATRYRKEFGRFTEGLYLSSRPYVSWKIPIGEHYYDLGEFIYTPRISATFNHELPLWTIPDYRKGPFLYFSHNIQFSRINWHGNFQRGAAASISNSNSFNFFDHKNGKNPWGTNFSISAKGYTMLGKNVGLTSRIMYKHFFLDDYEDYGGNVIRGVLDNKIKADYLFAMNFDLPIRVLKLRPSNWSERNRFLRIFDFDLHVSPVVDIGFYNNVNTLAPFGLENMLLGGGLELIIYPERWRSLFLRISVALGLQTGKLSDGFTREIFIGTELFY